MRKIFAVFVLLLCAACAETSFPKYSALVNQGILPLSTTNAYLGSNLFIAEEAQRSRQLYNFLSARGGPTAMELDETGSGRPHLLMFYPKDKEVYAAELTDLKTENGGRFREWVIRGPYSIERKDYKDLARLENSFVGEPVFNLAGREHRFRFQPAETEEKVKTVLVPVLPTPAPTPRPKRTPKVIVKKGEEPTKVEEFKPLNSDQQALRMSQGYAERADNGDVIHTVKGGETLNSIAKWYSGAEINAIAIATVNQLQLDSPLQPGMRIKVPAKIVKNDKQMPASFK